MIKRTSDIVSLVLVVALASSGIFLFLFTGDLKVQAQSQEENWIENIWRRLTSRPQSDESQTSTNKGGGNRGGLCRFTEEELVAIVPAASASSFSYTEKTLSERPVIRFYVPYEPQQGLNARFEIIDANEDTFYGSTFKVAETPGIVTVAIPNTQPGLKEGDRYSWVFSIVCDPNDRSGDATVDGEIERTSIAQFSLNPNDLAPNEQLRFYADNLLWFDFIEALLQETDSEPNVEWKEQWQYLLSQMGLNENIVPDEVHLDKQLMD